MSTTSLKRYILQSIEHLRNRKARPDLHRICNMLKKRHNFNFAETTRCIENLMDMGVVMKVEYKGSISYRDAARWKKGNVAGQIMNTDVLVAKIQTAIDAVTGRQVGPANEDGEVNGQNSEKTTDEFGATKEQIEEYLNSLTGDSNCQLRGDAMFEALMREVDTGRLRKLENGTYAVGQRQPPPSPRRQSRSPVKGPLIPKVKPILSIPPAPDTEDSNVDDSILKKRGRPPSKRKRFLKNHGDDFEVLPIGKQRKAVPSFYDSESESKEFDFKRDLVNGHAENALTDQNSICSNFRTCFEQHLTEIPSRHAGQEQELLECQGCNMKVHPSCVNYSEELVQKLDRKVWRCISCKICEICKTLMKTASPVTCSVCDRAYHRACHKPLLRKRPKGCWKCMHCTEPIDDKVISSTEENLHESVNQMSRREHDTSFPPTPCDSPSPDSLGKCSPEMPILEPVHVRVDRRNERHVMISRYDGQSFPDVVDWSVEKVVKFVESIGFTEQAKALEAEEIDGEALLDLKRNDVLTRFSLKLGPALKLYRLILNMQTNGNAHDFI